MDKQRKQLAKIIEELTNQYFCINGLKAKPIGIDLPRHTSLNKQNEIVSEFTLHQDELLSGVITHLMMAQGILNKYVNDKKLTRKAND